MLPLSNDTLLRVVRRRAHVPTEPLNVIGINDWAWRRNHRYGTIICDLERGRPVTLLPDREPAKATAWLERHQDITVVARDRGGEYGEAVTRALPRATQVADRWHLMENASRAFLDAVRKTMRQIRTAIGAKTINPELLTAAERLQYAISGGKRSTPRSSRWQKTGFRSKRSCGVSVTAGNLCAESFGESGRTSFVPGRVR
jgi:transposase